MVSFAGGVHRLRGGELQGGHQITRPHTQDVQQSLDCLNLDVFILEIDLFCGQKICQIC